MSTDSRIDLTAFSERIATLRQRVADNVVGQSQPVHLLLTALMADGQIRVMGRRDEVLQAILRQNGAPTLKAAAVG